VDDLLIWLDDRGYIRHLPWWLWVLLGTVIWPFHTAFDLLMSVRDKDRQMRY
jgi:hypothetical protein